MKNYRWILQCRIRIKWLIAYNHRRAIPDLCKGCVTSFNSGLEYGLSTNCFIHHSIQPTNFFWCMYHYQIQPFIITVNPGAVSADLSSYAFPQFFSDMYRIVVTAGVQQSLIVTTRDDFGNTLSTRMGETLTIQTKNSDQSFADMFSYTVTYIGYGQFSCAFNLLKAQRYEIQILISDKQISNSPFFCTVVPSYAVGEKSFNTSEIPSLVVAGDNVNFTIQVVCLSLREF
jgi:hypothetical protein